MEEGATRFGIAVIASIYLLDATIFLVGTVLLIMSQFLMGIFYWQGLILLFVPWILFAGVYALTRFTPGAPTYAIVSSILLVFFWLITYNYYLNFIPSVPPLLDTIVLGWSFAHVLLSFYTTLLFLFSDHARRLFARYDDE